MLKLSSMQNALQKVIKRVLPKKRRRKTMLVVLDRALNAAHIIVSLILLGHDLLK